MRPQFYMTITADQFQWQCLIYLFILSVFNVLVQNMTCVVEVSIMCGRVNQKL